MRTSDAFMVVTKAYGLYYREHARHGPRDGGKTMTTRSHRRRLLGGLTRSALIASLSPRALQAAIATLSSQRADDVVRLRGTLTVNGKPATTGTPVRLDDLLATGPDSEAVVHLAGDAFLLRSRTQLQLAAASGGLRSVLVVAGRVLSVFARRPPDRPLDVRIPSATIGIRGTGMYLELGRRRSYFCLCYGTAVVSGSSIDAPVTIETRHHESPVWLDASGRAMRVMAAPFRNHTDDELLLLEALAGRVPPFRPDDRRY